MERLILAAALAAVLTPCQGFNIDREPSSTFQDPARGFEQGVVPFRTDLEERLNKQLPRADSVSDNYTANPTPKAKMVQREAEEKAAIISVLEQLDEEVDGPEVLGRVLTIYLSPQRFRRNIGYLSSVAAILGDPNVREHGKKDLTALRGAVKNMDNIKGTLAHLSELHAEKLNVDPQNFNAWETA